MAGKPAASLNISPCGPSLGTTTTTTASTTVTAQSAKSAPSLRPTPAISRLKPRGFLPSSSLSPPPHSSIARSKTEPTPPTATLSPSAASDNSLLPRRKASTLSKPTLSKPPSSIPKPAMTSTSLTVSPMPLHKSKTTPPSKHYAAFSFGSSSAKAPPSAAATGPSEKSEKKPRNVIRRKNSASNSHSAFGLGSLRTGSTTSANGSTTSITSTSSYAGLGTKSGSSGLVLGIPLPSSRSASSLHHHSKSNASSSLPKPSAYDLPQPININPGYASSSSTTNFNDSPGNFSMASTPSSVSLPSPGFPPSNIRQRAQSPSRPPVTRNRSGSIGQLLNELGDVRGKADGNKGLDSVRESTTSTSSSSTVRAGGLEGESNAQAAQKSPASPSIPSPPASSGLLNSLSPRIPSSQVPTKASSQAPAHIGTFRSKSSNSVPTRPSREGTPDLHAAGLGVTIPVIHSNLAPGTGLVKTRSKSTGNVGLGIKTTAQKKGPAPSATPPLPSPSLPPSASGSRRPSVTNTGSGPPQNTPPANVASPTIGFAYSSLPSATSTKKKEENSDRRNRDRSPVRASPGKTSRPSLFSRSRSKTSDHSEPRKGPAAGTGHEGYGPFGRPTRGRSGSNTSTSGSWGRSGSQSSITSDSNFGSGSGRRSGSRGSRADMDDYFMDKLKPVVLAGGGEVVENQNFSSPEYRPRNGSTSDQGGFAMSRSGSENTNADPRRPGSRDSPTYTQIVSGKVFGTRRAATPIPAPINTSSKPFSHARTPSFGRSPQRPREVKQAVINAHTKMEKAFTPVLGQEVWTNDVYGQISPPLATDPLPTTTPVKTKRWNFLQRSQPTAAKNNSLSPQIPAIAGRRQARPPHYAMLDPYEQQEAAQVKDLMLELRNKAKEPHDKQAENMRQYTSAIRQQQHIHSVLLPDPPPPPQSGTSPRPLSPPTTTPSPGVNVTPALAPLSPIQTPARPRKNTGESESLEASKQEISENRANGQKRMHQMGGRLPMLGFGKKVESPQQPTKAMGHRTRPSESEIKLPRNQSQKHARPLQGALPQLQTQFSRRLQIGGPEGWSAPAHIGPEKHIESTLAQQIANRNLHMQPLTAAKESGQPQVDWSSYELSDSSKKAVASSGHEACDPLDTAGSEVRRNDWPVRKDSIPYASFDPVFPISADTIEPIAAKTEPAEEIEDVWSEYDDLFEDKDFFGRPFSLELELEAATKSSGIKSNTSSLGFPFQFDNLTWMHQTEPEKEELVNGSHTHARESPTLPDPGEIEPSSGSSAASDKTNSTVFELDESPTLQTAQIASSSTALPSIRIVPLNKEKDKNIPPPTPFSMEKFLQYYSGAGNEENDDTVLNAIDAVHHGAGSMKSRISNGSNSSSGSNGSVLSELGLEDEMKLRLWALMASTWLNFDRVLVSPAHEELKGSSAKGKEKAREDFEGRILVVDGLGTDEWSYYCALTYPSCKVYNLSPSLGSSETGANGQDSPTGLSKPPNHKQIHHSSFDAVFPFPVGFFNVVSLRFLPACTYPSLPFILRQCQRVLAPGGYIEVSILDADLVNMGNKTKRAVELNRGIMMREFEDTALNSMPETVSPLSPATIAARPASERVLKLLAKGFEDVNRCIVGLPVVGHIDGSLSFGSVHGSIDHTQNPPNVKPSEGATNGQEMLRKPIDAHDSSITEVVSKVGRYWYTRTYERVITGAKGEAMGRSMWMDKGLLRECAKKKTGIRMLVAYARKASVPITQAGVKPTLKLMVPESVSKVADDAANSAITSSSMTVPFKLDVSQSSRPVITNQIKRCNVSERRVAFQD